MNQEKREKIQFIFWLKCMFSHDSFSLKLEINARVGKLKTISDQRNLMFNEMSIYSGYLTVQLSLFKLSADSLLANAKAHEAHLMSPIKITPY